MKRLLLACAILFGFLLPAQSLGGAISSSLVSSTEVLTIYEHGLRIVDLDGDTIQCAYSTTVGGGSQLITEWLGTDGVVHKVVTNVPEGPIGSLQLASLIYRHDLLVTAMRTKYPAI